MIFTEQFAALDFSNTFYQNVILKDNVLIIPCINLLVSHHPLNPDEKPKFIDKAYVVFEGIKQLNILGDSELVNQPSDLPSHYLSGKNLDPSSIFMDMEIKAEKTYIQILENSQVSDNQWIPIESNDSKPNLSEQETKAFFKGELMPDNLKKLLGLTD
jgi:hypothetical protein